MDYAAIAGDGSTTNRTVQLLSELPPQAVYNPSVCKWPWPERCDSRQLQVVTNENKLKVVVLLGRSLHGARTSAVISHTPQNGKLYQINKTSCCDIDSVSDDPGCCLAAEINDGDAVSNINSAVAYVPTRRFSGVDQFSFFVGDSSGTASAVANMSVTVRNVENPPTFRASEALTTPLTPVYVPFEHIADDDGDLVTLKLERLPSNGSLYLSMVDGSVGQKVSQFSGVFEVSQISDQFAVDVVKASSWWPSCAPDYHPLQILGPRGERSPRGNTTHHLCISRIAC
eukprot:1660086-Prymnesium_polylepis.1